MTSHSTPEIDPRKRIQPLYKANPPYILVPGDEGVGYYGVLMYDRLTDKVQCHVCGMWLKALNTFHLREHGLSIQEYRDRFGFIKSIPLCSKGTSQKHKEQIQNQPHIYQALRKAVPAALKKATEARQQPAYRAALSKAFTKASYKNQRSLCVEQLRHRLNVVAIQCRQQSPAYEEILRYDPPLIAILRRYYGSYLKGKEALGFQRRFRDCRAKDDILIANLRKWVVDNGRLPPANRYPQYITCVKHFGSWKQAKAIAGLRQWSRDKVVGELLRKEQPNDSADSTGAGSVAPDRTTDPRSC